MNLSSRTSLLVYLAHSNPRIWEIIHPHVPKVSEGTRNIMASMLIKSIAGNIKDAGISKKLNEIGKGLFNAGSKSMSYDDDDWCPTRPRPHFGPGPSPDPWIMIFGEEVMLNPQPLPPHEKNYYGALVSQLAEAISVKDISSQLRNIGESLMKGKTR